jgi:hypothetical protein
VRTELAPHYSPIGRPSIDPLLMIRMLIIGYVFAIRSERALCREVRLNLEAQPKVPRGQPKASAWPKSVPRPAAKKANTPPALNAQREQQLYQEFLEWRKRQKDQP